MLFTPMLIVMMEPAAGSYVFRILNFADEPPIMLQLQLRWVDPTQPPIAVSGLGFDSGLGFFAGLLQMVNWRGKSI
ncbi:MAG TPA: hypothetical protein PKY88_00025 [Anaerohalosphaeraceae bacterium]|nr:hypothetical protein [Anaerohalosphaeraceae bacterium]